MKVLLAGFFVVLPALAWGQTYPTTPVRPDIRIATPLRTLTVTGSGAGSNFQTLLTNCILGDEIVLAASTTYLGEFTIPSAGCTGTLANGGNENYLTIRTANVGSLPASGTRVTAAHVAQMPKLRTNGTAQSVLACKGTGNQACHHIRIVGIYFSTPQITTATSILDISALNPTDYAVSANYPHHISIERSIFRPGDGGFDASLWDTATDDSYDFGVLYTINHQVMHLQILDNLFLNCHIIGNAETKCSTDQYGQGPFLIQNNQFSSGGGEMVFFGANSNNGPKDCPQFVEGYMYCHPQNITIRRNYFFAKEAFNFYNGFPTYHPPCPFVNAGGTITSVGTTVTFTISQPWSGVTPYQTGGGGLFLKNLATGQVVGITAGSGTSYTTSPAFSPAASGASFRTNYSSDTGSNQYERLARKNSYEQKAGFPLLMEQNIFENGWADSQQNTVSLKSTEYGWTHDVEVRWNKWINAAQPISFPIDSHMGNGGGPAPHMTSKVWLHQNLFQDIVNSGGNSPYALGPDTNFAPYGYLGNAGENMNIQAAATTGTGVTFTASGGTFWGPEGDGQLQIWLTDNALGTGTGILGKGTIRCLPASGGVPPCTPVSSVATARVDITSAFPNTNAYSQTTTPPGWWYGGLTPAAAAALTPPGVPVGGRYSTDSWIIEHNTMTPDATSPYAAPLEWGDGSAPSDSTVIPATNVIVRNNIFGTGTLAEPIVGSNAGNGDEKNLRGTANVHPVYFTSEIFNKNVFFGPDITLSHYACSGGCASGGYGSGFGTAFVTPDQNGGTHSSGAVGFTDYAGGNFKLASGQFKNWATDGADPGVDWDTFQAKIAGVVAGTPEGTTTTLKMGSGTLKLGSGTLKLGQ